MPIAIRFLICYNTDVPRDRALIPAREIKWILEVKEMEFYSMENFEIIADLVEDYNEWLDFEADMVTNPFENWVSAKAADTTNISGFYGHSALINT